MYNEKEQEKSKTTKFDAVAVAIFIALGIIGFGYGAISAINDAVHRRHTEKHAQTIKSCDTINYISTKKWADSENQR